MKSWKSIVCLLCLAFFIMAVPACQQAGGAKGIELRGAIQKAADDSGFYIRSGGKRYHIESEQDLSALVGKMVTMKGSVEEADGQLTVRVDSVVQK
jgi:hypothetical protein